MSLLSAIESDLLTVVPWPDDVIDALGHDPRSNYVETYWLGTLGPSTTWLLRRLVAGLDTAPNGYDLSLSETATALGLGNKGGRHSPFVRALSRCVQFDMAQAQGDTVLAVRRKLPPLNRRQVMRLPAALQASHARWQQEQLELPLAQQQRQRARHLALSLLELGEEPELAERQLLRWRYHPAMAKEAMKWAVDRSNIAAEAARAATNAARVAAAATVVPHPQP